MRPPARLPLPTAPPVWLASLLGWWLGSALLVRVDPAPLPPACTLDRGPPRERAPSPRELRALEGLGPARSTAVSRALWERLVLGGDRPLADVRGIGPVTAARVEAWLGRTRAPVAPPEPSAYTPDDARHGP